MEGEPSRPNVCFVRRCVCVRVCVCPWSVVVVFCADAYNVLDKMASSRAMDGCVCLRETAGIPVVVVHFMSLAPPLCFRMERQKTGSGCPRRQMTPLEEIRQADRGQDMATLASPPPPFHRHSILSMRTFAVLSHLRPRSDGPFSGDDSRNLGEGGGPAVC